ncbi:MAG: hypothetical protein M0P52_01795 [Rhodoferax sp.]|nr:hypothetical protein [Rhodoferax sp.]
MQRTFGTVGGTPASRYTFDNLNQAHLGKDMGWAQLLESQRILLIAEAGAGKTHECKAQAKLLFEDGEAAFFLRLEEVAASGVRLCLYGEQQKRFDDWRASASQTGYFFLDSIDELQLAHADFRDALERLGHDLEGGWGRATIVVTSRPVDIDRMAFAELLPVPKAVTDGGHEEEFVRIAVEGPAANDKSRPPRFREVCLQALSDEQIMEFAGGQGVVKPDELLAAIHARHAGDFARRPQDLIELCDDWRDHHQIRAHFEQIKSHIHARLMARAGRQEKADLTLDKARVGAQRLALAATLSRRLSIRHSAGADVEGSGDVPLIPSELLSDWTATEIVTLLERPIFAEGGYGRVRFHHRSVLEFLAASQINDMIESGALAVSAAKRMLFSLSDTQTLLPKPSMRPVAGWLALLRQDIFDAVLAVEPSTLLIHGDPESLSDVQCGRALQAFVLRHGADQWRGLDVPDLQLDRLARKPLQTVILTAWSSGIENPEVRQILIKLVASGRYAQCADLMFAIAGDANADDRERFDALYALIELGDYRVEALLELAASLESGWNARIARWIATHFYPEHVSEDQLLGLLTHVQTGHRRDDYFASSMARVIEQADLGLSRLEALLPGVLALTRSLVVVVAADDALGDRKGRMQASYILRALCARLLEGGSNVPDLIEAAVLAFRAAGHSSLDDERKRQLAKLLNALPLERRRLVFEADYDCTARLEPRREPQSMVGRVLFQGPIQYSQDKDQPWIVNALGDASADRKRRAVLLRMVVFLAPTDGLNSVMDPVRVAIADSPALKNELAEQLKTKAPTPEILQMLEQESKRNERQRLKQANDKKDWTAFWTELVKRTALALAPGRVDTTIWNLWKVLRKKSGGNNEGRWDRAFLEECFSANVADALRRSLMTYWRGMKPTLREERQAAEKNTYLVVWSIGLMGLYAEAEDPRWTKTLSDSDVELAVRYALLELNGLPDWLATLADAYGPVVERVLGGELTDELKTPGGDGRWHSMLLQSLRYGRLEIARVLQARLTEWLAGPGMALMRKPHDPAAEAKLDQVIRVLLTHGDSMTRRWIQELATRQVSAAGHGPYLFFWLPVLFHLNPARGTAMLLRLLDKLPVETKGIAVKVIGCLFNERRVEGKADWRKALPPDTLLRLTRAVQRHVRPEKDAQHEDAYSPDSRDNAEDGRRYVFDALIQATGADAFQAKLELASDPMFAHARDRIAALAQERLAEETDASVATMAELARLYHGRELAPVTSTDMAHLLSDRLDDLQGLMLQDTSPRAAWARVSDENSLRPAIALQLDQMSRGAYTVDQESVTADGKETDIKFRALSGYQATIELKIGEKSRSGKVLRDTIEGQLVNKYMAASNARTGCLVVTVADAKKRWQHPDTGVLIDRYQLHQMLSEAAQLAQQRLGGDARVMARVLDLTPRLGKEAGNAKVSRPKAAGAPRVKGKVPSKANGKAAGNAKSGKTK